jgi:hypothetical protein
MMRALTITLLSSALAAALAVSLAGCDETVGGQRPVGGSTATDAELERFVRRLHLDLAGQPPTDEALAAERQQLADAGNTAAARRVLAEGLVAAPAFAEVYVAELENRVYGGDTADGRYDFVCAILRIQECTCPPPSGDDYCAGCASCAPLGIYEAERVDLAETVADLAGGATTSSIERRYANTYGFRAISGSVEAVATNLIEVFLGRTPQSDELENAAAMVAGALAEGATAGLLYHRYGSDYADLIDIVFSDEIYREAMTTFAFARYLGRPPTPPELRHFTALIDAANPDARPVILAITSSREYFQP